MLKKELYFKIFLFSFLIFVVSYMYYLPVQFAKNQKTLFCTKDINNLIKQVKKIQGGVTLSLLDQLKQNGKCFKQCPILEKNDSKILFNNVVSNGFKNHSGIKWQKTGNNIYTAILCGNLKVVFEYKNDLKDGCSFICKSPKKVCKIIKQGSGDTKGLYEIIKKNENYP